MRLAVVLNLVTLVLLCPLICGTVEADPDAHPDRTSHCKHGAPAEPLHCPAEGASCVCQGAVLAQGARANSVMQTDFLAPDGLFTHHLPATSHILPQLSDQGCLASLATGSGAPAACAILQQYRC